MMTSSNGNIFRVTGPFVRVIYRSRWIPRTGASDAELWFFSLIFSLIYTRINGLINNGDAGELRRNRSHYDVTVMDSLYL